MYLKNSYGYHKLATLANTNYEAQKDRLWRKIMKAKLVKVCMLGMAVSMFAGMGVSVNASEETDEYLAEIQGDYVELFPELAKEENRATWEKYTAEYVDEDAGMFQYFAFSPDTPETTYHLEFRYADNTDDLQNWFEGNYAYWNAAAISKDYDEEMMDNCIELFCSENLGVEEE